MCFDRRRPSMDELNFIINVDFLQYPTKKKKKKEKFHWISVWFLAFYLYTFDCVCFLPPNFFILFN